MIQTDQLTTGKRVWQVGGTDIRCLEVYDFDYRVVLIHRSIGGAETRVLVDFDVEEGESPASGCVSPYGLYYTFSEALTALQEGSK